MALKAEPKKKFIVVYSREIIIYADTEDAAIERFDEASLSELNEESGEPTRINVIDTTKH